MSRPPDFQFLAEQILAYTRVDWDPKYPEAGQKIVVQTIPGILPFIPPDMAGQLGLPTGPLNVLLEALVKAVKFTVRYQILVNGEETSNAFWDPLSPTSLPDSDPLQILLFVVPPLVEERKLHHSSPNKVELVATVSVDVEGNKVEQSFPITLPIPPIPLPTFLVLTGGAEPSENQVFVMARSGSSFTDVSGAITAINSAIQALNGVTDVLSLETGFDLLLNALLSLVGSLTDAVDMITGATGIAGCATEEAPNLGDYNDFDEKPRSSLLFGPGGTRVEFFSGENYNAHPGWHNHSTFVIPLEDPPVPLVEDDAVTLFQGTGFGVHYVENWEARHWDTDEDAQMYDDYNDPQNANCESCKYIN